MPVGRQCGMHIVRSTQASHHLEPGIATSRPASSSAQSLLVDELSSPQPWTRDCARVLRCCISGWPWNEINTNAKYWGILLTSMSNQLGGQSWVASTAIEWICILRICRDWKHACILPQASWYDNSACPFRDLLLHDVALLHSGIHYRYRKNLSFSGYLRSSWHKDCWRFLQDPWRNQYRRESSPHLCLEQEERDSCYAESWCLCQRYWDFGSQEIGTSTVHGTDRRWFAHWTTLHPI